MLDEINDILVGAYDSDYETLLLAVEEVLSRLDKMYDLLSDAYDALEEEDIGTAKEKLKEVLGC